MFIDNVKIKVSSGKGGAGAVSFHREKFIIKGGPDGGNGGDGGDVYFVVDKNTNTLSYFKNRKVLKAKNGQPGKSKNMYGKKGESLIIKVPPGTVVKDAETGEKLLDLVEDGKKVLFLKGGKGGLGNVHFKSATNQRPTYAQPGLPGETKEIILELKLIADVGLVGFPNVGKSTLISTISNARPEIANYEFTTLTPKLGVVEIGNYKSFVMADIPGIIENASEGRGLGIEFLRHIERTKTLLYMIDMSNYRTPIEQFEKLRQEVFKFSEKMREKKYAIALTKIDAMYEDKIKEFFDYLNITPSKHNDFGIDDKYPYYVAEDKDSDLKFVLPISSVTHYNIKPLKYLLYKFVEDEKNSN